jgi:hypothetical protein
MGGWPDNCLVSGDLQLSYFVLQALQQVPQRRRQVVENNGRPLDDYDASKLKAEECWRNESLIPGRVEAKTRISLPASYHQQWGY